jgi:hypothetical protein
MYYRIHDENDSNIEDTVGGIALLNYIAKKGISKNQDFFVAMRYDLWRKWLVKQDKVNSALLLCSKLTLIPKTS